MNFLCLKESSSIFHTVLSETNRKLQKCWWWASWAIFFTCSGISFFLYFVLFCMQSGVNDLSPWKSLGYRLFQSTDAKTRKLPKRTSHILCQILFFLFDISVGVFNCVTILFTSSEQPIIMTISLNISDSIKILSSSMQFFMSFHTAGFTFNLVTWYLDIIWENFLGTSSFQILMTLTFVFPWVNLVATELSVTFQPLTADLGPCYLTVTPPPLVIWHSNQAMLSLQDSSVWDDSGPPEVVPVTFSGASSFCTSLCPKIRDRETQRGLSLKTSFLVK